MTSRPILFSAPMIRALLAGRKTQTRRTVKWPDWVKDHDAAALGLGGRWPAIGLFSDGRPVKKFTCPYGQPGDELWVRETIKRVPASSPMHDAAVYAADGAETSLDTWPWERGVLPAIHCPRGLSRITLRVTSVRVERLQAISEADAMAEGAAHRISTGGDLAGAFDTCDTPINYRAHFRDLWESINGAGSWARNDWVWVVGFEVVSDVRVEDLRRKDVFMVRAFTSFDLPTPQSWRALVWHKSRVVIVDLGGPHWSPLNVAHELRRDDLEHWATVRSGTRWCGLTAAEILVRLDEWLSMRNG